MKKRASCLELESGRERVDRDRVERTRVAADLVDTVERDPSATDDHENPRTTNDDSHQESAGFGAGATFVDVVPARGALRPSMVWP